MADDADRMELVQVPTEEGKALGHGAPEERAHMQAHPLIEGHMQTSPMGPPPPPPPPPTPGIENVAQPPQTAQAAEATPAPPNEQ